MAKHLVVLLLELDSSILKESGLTEKQFEELPTQIIQQLKKIAPKALKPTGAFFLSTKEKNRLEKVLDARALDFDEMVLSYGKPEEKKPQTCTVLRLDSYRRRQRKSAGEV